MFNELNCISLLSSGSFLFVVAKMQSQIFLDFLDNLIFVVCRVRTVIPMLFQKLRVFSVFDTVDWKLRIFRNFFGNLRSLGWRNLFFSWTDQWHFLPIQSYPISSYFVESNWFWLKDLLHVSCAFDTHVLRSLLRYFLQILLLNFCLNKFTSFN